MHGLCAGKREYSEDGRGGRDDSVLELLGVPRVRVKRLRLHHHPPVCSQNLPVPCARGEVQTRGIELVFDVQI